MGISTVIPTRYHLQDGDAHHEPFLSIWNWFTISKIGSSGQFATTFIRQLLGIFPTSTTSFYKFDPTSASRGFETRSWSAVSDILKAEGNDDLELLSCFLVAGAIGDGTARNLWNKGVDNRPSMVADVLSGKVKSIKKVRSSSSICLSPAFCYELANGGRNISKPMAIRAFKKSKDYKDLIAAVDNHITFVIENMMPEIAIMSLRLALKAHDLLITDSTRWKAA